MSNKIITLDHLTTYDGKIKKYIADNSDAVTGEIEEKLANYVDLSSNQTITGPKALTGNIAVNTLNIGMPYGMGGNNSQPQNILITTNGQKLNFKSAIVANHAGTAFDFGTDVLSHIKNDGNASYLKLPVKGTSDSPAILATEDYVDNAINSSRDTITIGNTTLNEEQLKKLLALIEAMETVTVEE